MSRRMFFCFLYSFSIISACNSVESIPSGVIKQEKMGTILFELGMAEGYLENYRFKDSTVNKDSLVTIEMDKVLAVHKVSQQEFLFSYKYYKAHPDIFKAMTDTVYFRTQRSQEKMYGKRLPPIKKEKKVK
jgi:hypothetical protein